MRGYGNFQPPNQQQPKIMVSLFNSQTTEQNNNKNANTDATETRHFPEPVPEYEVFRFLTNQTTKLGNAIREDDRIMVNEREGSDAVTDRDLSPRLAEYDATMSLKKEISEKVYSDDRPGLKAYVAEHPEPNLELLAEFTRDFFGLELVGIEWDSREEAAQIGIDYDDPKTWEVFTPIFEEGAWEMPPALIDADPTPEPEPEPATETNVTVEDSMSAGDRAAFHKRDYPHLSNEKVGEKFGVSGQAVANACKRNFGEDGYEEIKQAGREARANSGGFEFGVATDGGEPETDLNERAKAAKALIDAGFTPEQATQILG